MSNDKFILHEWQKDKMDALEKYEEYEAGRLEGRAEGKTEGIEEAIQTTIKSMLENHIDIELIAKITNKNIEEIEAIKKSLED